MFAKKQPKVTVALSLPASTLYYLHERKINLSAVVESGLMAASRNPAYRWPTRPRGRPPKNANPFLGLPQQMGSTTISLTPEAVNYVSQLRKAVPGFDLSLWVRYTLRGMGIQ